MTAILLSRTGVIIELTARSNVDLVQKAPDLFYYSLLRFLNPAWLKHPCQIHLEHICKINRQCESENTGNFMAVLHDLLKTEILKINFLKPLIID